MIVQAKKRQLLEEKGEIIPYLEVLSRKSPEGSRIVTEDEKLVVIAFFESDNISDVLKGRD